MYTYTQTHQTDKPEPKNLSKFPLNFRKNEITSNFFLGKGDIFQTIQKNVWLHQKNSKKKNSALWKWTTTAHGWTIVWAFATTNSSIYYWCTQRVQKCIISGCWVTSFLCGLAGNCERGTFALWSLWYLYIYL